jgi:hypothetical protein
MVGQAVDLLGQTVSGKRLEGLDDAGMQRPPPLLQETLVSHLMGERMLKGIFDLGEEARLIQELGSLQMREA